MCVFTGKSERASFLGYGRDPAASGCQVSLSLLLLYRPLHHFHPAFKMFYFKTSQTVFFFIVVGSLIVANMSGECALLKSER